MDGFAASGQAEFVARYGQIFEHSPWIAAQAWAMRPFANVAELHAAMMAVLAAATQAAQLNLINAHPELAVRKALTDASAAEQQGAGLKNLDGEEFATFAALNAEYRQKFRFPFVICVRDHDKDSILDAFRQRLSHSVETERAAALAEIGKIAWLRLRDMPL